MASSYWILEKLQMVGIASNIRHIIKAFTTTLPIVGKLIQRKIWNGKLILIGQGEEKVKKRIKEKYILNKLPNISVLKQTFFRG